MGKYEDFLKSIPRRETLLDPLMSLDNRIDFLGPVVVDIHDKVERLEAAMGVIAKKVEQIPFIYTLAVAGAVGSGITLTEKAPFNGYVKEITIDWPGGCNNLVDVMVGHNVGQFCPREGWLALNNATPTYKFEYSINVKEGEAIWVRMQNRDGGWPHQITVTVHYEEE